MNFKEAEDKAKAWWGKNKKTIYIVTGVAVAAFGGYYAYRSFKLPATIKTAPVSLMNTHPALASAVATIESNPNTTAPRKLLNNGVPFPVSGHTRSCPMGKHPSAEKLAFAAEKGIELAPNQTFVNSYMKNIA